MYSFLEFGSNSNIISVETYNFTNKHLFSALPNHFLPHKWACLSDRIYAGKLK